MDKFKNTWQGQLSTLRDNWSMTMQRMTGGLFDWAKTGLKHANQFFDRFNIGLDRGLNPFQAGMRALKFTLQDVLGKGPGNVIFAGIDAIVGGFQRAIRLGMEFAKVVTGIGGVLGAAFFEGDRSRFFQMLPSWLRDSVGALGTMAEGFGDIWRTLRQEGLGAALADLFGAEGRQIRNAAGRLAGELWDGFVWGVQNFPWGTVWDTVAGLVGEIPDLGEKAIRFIPRLAEELWEGAGDVWGWIKSKLTGGGAASTVGDGTGGPESDRQPINVGSAFIRFGAALSKDIWEGAGDVTDWVTNKVKEGWTQRVPIGNAIIDGTATLGATLAGIAGDLSGWLTAQISGAGIGPGSGNRNGTGSFNTRGAGGGITVTLAQMAIDVLDAVADVTKADIEGWIQEQIGTLGRINAEINDWSIALTGEPAFAFAGGDVRGGTGGAGGGPGVAGANGWLTRLNRWLNAQADAINGENGWLLDATNWVFRITGQPDMQVENISEWQDTMQEIVGKAFEGDYSQTVKFALNTVGRTIENELNGWQQSIRDGLNRAGNAMKSGWDQLKSAVSTDNAWISAALDTILGPIDEFVAALQAAWDIAGPLINLLTGGLGGGGKPLPDTTITYPEPMGGDYGFGDNQQFGGNTARPPQGGGPGTNSLGRMAPIKLPAPDTSAVNSAIDGIKSKLAGLSKSQSRVRIDGDNSGFMDALAIATQAAVAWNSLTATAKLAGDNAPFTDALMFALQGGMAWENATFTADLAGNADPFMIAAAAAFDMGRAFDGTTFSATFSADISPLENALTRTRQIAQEISDLLPRSPAKKGPLARPISFGYIGDSLLETMRGMVRDTQTGMAGVAGALGLSGVAGSGRASGRAALLGPRREAPIINVYAVKSDELVDLINGAQIGLRLGRNLSTQLQLLSQGSVR